MADPISAIMPGGPAQNLTVKGEQYHQHQGPGRSFDNVLRKDVDGHSDPENMPALRPEPISGAKLEQMRLDLMERISRIPPGKSLVEALAPEFIDTRTRLGYLRQAMSGPDKPITGTDLRARLANIEREWLDLDRIMHSDKDLSTGELLGLQARLYQVAQHVEVLSKVVDQLTGGIRTILNTNV
jgi:hypothetical protein